MVTVVQLPISVAVSRTASGIFPGRPAGSTWFSQVGCGLIRRLLSAHVTAPMDSWIQPWLLLWLRVAIKLHFTAPRRPRVDFQWPFTALRRFHADFWKALPGSVRHLTTPCGSWMALHGSVHLSNSTSWLRDDPMQLLDGTSQLCAAFRRHYTSPRWLSAALGRRQFTAPCGFLNGPSRL